MKKKWRNSLRTKIIGWSFIPTLIILSAVAGFTFYSYQKVIGDLTVRQDWAVVQSKTGPINQAIVDINQPIVIPIILTIDNKLEDSIQVRAQRILDQAKNLDVLMAASISWTERGRFIKPGPTNPN